MLFFNRVFEQAARISMIAAVIVPTSLVVAGDCAVFPGGEFENGLRDWTLEEIDSPGVAGFAEASFSITDAEGYTSFSGPVKEFDTSVLQLGASIVSTPGQLGSASAEATLSIETEMTDGILRIVRGGGFFVEWLGSGIDIEVVLSATNQDGVRAELPLFGWLVDPAPSCTGIAIDGTFDAAETPALYLDLHEAGLEIGDSLTVAFEVRSSFESTMLCGTTAATAFMLIDDVSFCSSAPNPYDLDGDDVVGFSDLLYLLNAWGQCEAPLALCPDLDGDLNVGFSDLLILLSNWGEGP